MKETVRGKLQLQNETLEKMLAENINNADVDTAAPEFEHEIPVKTISWAGLKVPEDIYVLCEHLKQMMVNNGKWSDALVYQVYNAALVGWLTTKLSTELISGKRVGHITDLTTASESFRRSLQGLGLIVDGKKVSIDASETNSPLSDMLNALQDGNDSQKKIISKKK